MSPQVLSNEKLEESANIFIISRASIKSTSHTEFHPRMWPNIIINLIYFELEVPLELVAAAGMFLWSWAKRRRERKENQLLPTLVIRV